MKTRYQCEKCSRYFATASEALDCENQTEDPQPPLGLIYLHTHSPTSGMLILMVVRRSGREEHSFYATAWAAREGQQLTDNGDAESCEVSLPLRQYNVVTAEIKESPAFKRCIEWCQRHGLTPTYWDGTKACSI